MSDKEKTPEQAKLMDAMVTSSDEAKADKKAFEIMLGLGHPVLLTQNIKPGLCILIPTIDGREHFLERLLAQLKPQIEALPDPSMVKIFIEKDKKGQHTIGEKRNMLLEKAFVSGLSHGVFLDDDDGIRPRYIELQMMVVECDADCGSLVGHYHFNGKYDRPFLHSIKYKAATQDANFYYRFPNHLNCWKLSIIRDSGIRFEHSNFGEDNKWAEKISNAGLFQLEFPITECIYDYFDRTKVDGILKKRI